jgi:hypothetical protein
MAAALEAEAAMKIFDAALSLLPSWVPVVAIGVLIAIAVGGFVALKASWQAEGAARIVAADRQVVIDQKERDARLSAALIANQAAQLAELSARSQIVITRIDNAPKTNGCGPVMRDASRGLHELFAPGAGGANAGREPAAAVPRSGAGR